jgi:hypothetical protein
MLLRDLVYQVIVFTYGIVIWRSPPPILLKDDEESGGGSMIIV